MAAATMRRTTSTFHLLVLVVVLFLSGRRDVTAFVVTSSTTAGRRTFVRPSTTATPKAPRTAFSRYRYYYLASTATPVGHDSTQENKDNNDDDEDYGDVFMDDETLLRTVTKDQLLMLCEQVGVSSSCEPGDTKQALLERLRRHADEQAAKEEERIRQRAQIVEEGTGDSKERHEIVPGSSEEDEDDEGYFYFQAPESTDTTSTDADADTSNDQNDEAKNAVAKEESNKKNKNIKATPPPPPSMITNAQVTAPPIPPGLEPNEDGERVVQIYSTTDQNDLTGVAASQPGASGLAGQDSLLAAETGAEQQPWDMMGTQQQRSAAVPAELEAANADVTELVSTLLAMTGAPAFQSLGDEDEEEGGRNEGSTAQPSFAAPSQGFVGFNPAKVPTDLLTAASKSLRADRGQVLQEVLRTFELEAIGQDGMKGDNREKGGGHYREVCKVRAFLEGYRRAEVRRLARETVAMLLDKLILEGLEGLDVTLASMTRATDDTSDHAGELNDSLLDYLNDAIRQQEKKVEAAATAETADTSAADTSAAPVEDDADVLIKNLWNVTTGEDGQRLESIDPNDPEVKRVLEQESVKQEQAMAVQQSQLQESATKSASEQLLMLLTLLRERIKVEATMPPDEKGRNLRLLAYCLRVNSDEEREQLIRKEVGTSVDRLDSFQELVASSIEYGESTSHQLQPSKGPPLNVRVLKRVLDTTESLRANTMKRLSP